MTVSATSTVNISTGNGVTTVFPYSFRILAAADIEVRVDGAIKALGVDYTVSGVGSDTGGNVTFLAAPANLSTVIRRRKMALTRGTDYQDNGDLLADVLNLDQDAAVLMAQQLQEEVDRTISIPVGESANLILPAAADRANRTPVFDGNGDLTVAATSADVQLAVDEALGFRNESESFRDGALAAQLAAEAAESNAEGAEALAEAARDSLIAAAGIYASTAAGLAGTVNDAYFWVPSINANESYILYLHNGAVAQEIKRLPSASAFTGLAAVADPGVRYAIQDSNDNAVLTVADSGLTATVLDVNTINDIPRRELARAVARGLPNMTASYVHHISYGQSLSVGSNAGIHTRTDVDGGFYDSVRFVANGSTTAGPRAQDGTGTVAQNHASFVAYEEQFNVAGFGETPLGNCLRMIKRLVIEEDGIAPADHEYVLVGSAPGQANIAIAGLIKTTTYYQRVIDDVTYGLAVAQAQGKSYAVDVVYWSQGEADIQQLTTRTGYKNAFLQLYTDLNTDIKVITGQAHDIKIIGYQVSMWDQFTYGSSVPTISLAQLDAAKENHNILLATCVYAVEHIASNDAHLSGYGSAHLGAYYGYCAKRVIVDGESWANLYPSRITRQGKILNVEFPDTGYPLAISNTLFDTQPNAGFTALRSDGVTANVITSVAVVGPRRVRVVLTNAEAGKLQYGFSNMGGNLHDTCDVDPLTARAAVLYRPCLTFEESYT